MSAGRVNASARNTVSGCSRCTSAIRLAEAHVAERQVGLLTGADCCALRGGPRRWSIGRLRVGVAELEGGGDYGGRPDADIDHWEDEQPVVDLGLVAHAVRQGHEHRPL